MHIHSACAHLDELPRGDLLLKLCILRPTCGLLASAAPRNPHEGRQQSHMDGGGRKGEAQDQTKHQGKGDWALCREPNRRWRYGINTVDDLQSNPVSAALVRAVQKACLLLRFPWRQRPQDRPELSIPSSNAVSRHACILSRDPACIPYAKASALLKGVIVILMAHFELHCPSRQAVGLTAGRQHMSVSQRRSTCLLRI